MPRKGVRLSADEIFDFTRRQSDSHAPPYATRVSGERSRNGRGRNSRHLLSSKPRSREQFVCANYAFGMSPEAMISVEDPDIPIDWDHVDVVFESSKPEDCPICLHPLRAPRITRCGHIFDHICALQHLHYSSGGREARCPLCSAPMSAPDLRSVAFRCQQQPSADENNLPLTLQLVARPRYSVIPRVYKADDIVDNFVHVPTNVEARSHFYARLAIADTDYLLDLITKAIAALDRVLKEDESLRPFVDIAKSVNKRERDALRFRRRHERVNEQPKVPLSRSYRGTSSFPSSDGDVLTNTSAISTCKSIPTGAVDGTSLMLSSCRFGKNGSPCGKDCEAEVASRCVATKLRQDQSASSVQGRSATGSIKTSHWPPHDANAHSSSAMYVFYQAKDGQNVFLHPLCHRIVTAEVEGDFSRARSEITTKVVDIERHTMDEALRRRFRFLGHLPFGCEFSFVEVDLSDAVSEQTLQVFHSEILERESARRERTIALERDSRRIARQESDSLRKYFELASSRVALSRQNQMVDSNDIRIFPPISFSDRSSTIAGSSSESDACSGRPVSELDESVAGRSSSCMPASQRDWGVSISSYSAATANMGVFPSLSAVVASSSSALENSSQSSKGGSSPIPVPSRSTDGNHMGSHVELHRPSISEGAWSHSPSRGVWGSSSSMNESSSLLSENHSMESHQNRTNDQVQPRRSRRHNGRATITLMSNAGPQHRR